MDIQQLLVFILVSISVGGFAFALLPYVTGEARAEKRQRMMQAVTSRKDRATALAKVKDSTARRNQIANSLKELEQRQKNLANPPLSLKLEQAGLSWSKEKYYFVCVVCGFIASGFILYMTQNFLVSAAAFIPGALGVPMFALKYLRKRRQEKFLHEFPNAIDIIVRGVKAGLPLGDCMRVVVSESPEPVKSEFREILETQAVGLPLSDAVVRMSASMGLAETNFFAIVMQIQAKSGGSLGEILTNLSRVLRDRKKMKAKIKAMSTEAKASAGIIGSLPIIVAVLVYLTSPRYIEVLWTTNAGLVLLALSGFWMFVGVMVMRKMIQFDF